MDVRGPAYDRHEGGTPRRRSISELPGSRKQHLPMMPGARPTSWLLAASSKTLQITATNGVQTASSDTSISRSALLRSVLVEDVLPSRGSGQQNPSPASVRHDRNRPHALPLLRFRPGHPSPAPRSADSEHSVAVHSAAELNDARASHTPASCKHQSSSCLANKLVARIGNLGRRAH